MLIEVTLRGQPPCVVIESVVGLGFFGSGVGALHLLFRDGLAMAFDLSQKNQKLVDQLEKHRMVIRSLQRGEPLNQWTEM